MFNFGKHLGKPVREQEEYLEWMTKSDFPSDTLEAIRRLKENEWRWP